jgi:hypothetical protein
MRTISKKRRGKMLDEQGHRCACCTEYLGTTADARLDQVQNKMLCPACMLLVSNVRKSRERNVTFATVENYLESGVAEVITIPGDTNRDEQRDMAREEVKAGNVPGMTLEEYDAKFNRE